MTKCITSRIRRVSLFMETSIVELADALLASYQKPEDLIGGNGLLKQHSRGPSVREIRSSRCEPISYHDRNHDVLYDNFF